MKPQPSRHALTSYLLGALLCATFACKPELQSGVYECNAGRENACPAGWLCQQRGGTDFRCYESEGGFCGDGAVDPGEQCDGEALGDTLVCGASSFPFCLTDCRVACTACGNGKREVPTPDRGEECDDGNLVDGDGCSAQCTLPFCGDGLVDASLFEGCDLGEYNSDEPGADCRTNCQPRRCGDGVVDVVHDEVCDDGNLDPTDNCTPDCKSDGRCGNGYVDFLKGELCDDGNFLSHDGCSSDCLSESPRWREESATSRPKWRQNHALTYDAARGRVVLFGGYDRCLGGPPETFGDTWEWDGTRWYQASTTTTSPLERSNHAIAYDPISRRVVLFGGSGEYVDGSTWEWDGTTWSVAASEAESPPARVGHAMAYDPVSRRVLLFGGHTSSDTWEWDGSRKKWQNVTPALSPAARSNAGMVFHPKLGRVLLHGGQASAGFTPLSDMWQWDGVTRSWTPVSMTGSAPSGNASQLAYDATRDTLVLAPYSHTVWEWRSGTGWTLKPVESGHAGVDRAVYFPPAQAVLAFGGVCEDSVAYWNGELWTSTTVPDGLTPGYSNHLLYNPLTRNLHSLHFPDANAVLWSWRNFSWTQVATPSPPAVYGETAATHDTKRGRIVLINRSGQTWEWDGEWHTATSVPDSVPNLRTTYDSRRMRTLLISGSWDSHSTWAWTGSTWNQLASVHTERAAFAFDPVRSRAVAFGGRGQLGPRSDLYELESAAWIAKFPLIRPPPTVNAAITFDHQLGKTLVQTGPSTWTWDGTAWSNVSPLGPPPPLFSSLTYHSTLRASVGIDNTGKLWSFRFEHPQARDESCQLGFDVDGDGLIGCADPDCWPYCTPLCGPGQVCEAWQPRCGDGQCNAALETCRMCPQDCGACPARCGDFFCDPGETNATCPGDCR